MQLGMLQGMGVRGCAGRKVGRELLAGSIKRVCACTQPGVALGVAGH